MCQAHRSTDRILPTSQRRNPANEHPGQETGNTKLYDLCTNPGLHLFDCDIWENKLTVLIAMTAIHRAAGSIGVCAAAFLIPLHRHPAALTTLVSFIHEVKNQLILSEVVLSSHSPSRAVFLPGS
jgi:hypothetical protein